MSGSLQGKKILLGVTGSIAAYKSILLTRLLVKAGAEVKVVLTTSARDFVTPLSLSTLSKNPVLSDLAEGDSLGQSCNELGRWADVMVIAPLSCNTLAKMANGLCDNLLLAVYLSATCPVIVAPAMDEDMWNHPAIKNNLEKLQLFGHKMIPVEKGELASGLYGDGRMAEPATIVQFIDDLFFLKDLEGKKALVTAGPTYEALDPVRFIGNHSSGKMGLAIARELAGRGAHVELVLGPSSLKIDIPGIHVTHVESAAEMFDASVAKFPGADIAILSSAVADYTPATLSKQKIKKTADTLTLTFNNTKVFLKTLGERKTNGKLLVGFALENTNEKQYAYQ